MSRYIATRAIRGATAHGRRGRGGGRAQALAELGPGRAGRLHQHRLLPAGDLRLHRPEGREARRPAGRHRARQGPAAPAAAATRCGCRTSARRWTAASPRSSPKRPWRACASRAGSEPQIIKLDHAGADGERFTGGDLLVHGDKMKLNGPIDDIQLRAWGIQLVDGRMPGLLRHRRLRQEQRGGREDRPRAAEPRHPHLPQRQRQRAQHHPPAAGRRHPARLRHLHRAVRHRHHLRRVRPGLRGALGAHVRRHGRRQRAQDHALQQVPRVRLRAGPRRGRRPQVRHRGRRHQLRLPDHRRHAHPADPAHRRDDLRARRQHALRRDPRGRRHGARREAHPALHGGPRRQGQDRQGADPGLLRIGLRGRTHPQGHHVRRVRRQAHHAPSNTCA